MILGISVFLVVGLAGTGMLLVDIFLDSPVTEDVIYTNKVAPTTHIPEKASKILESEKTPIIEESPPIIIPNKRVYRRGGGGGSGGSSAPKNTIDYPPSIRPEVIEQINADGQARVIISYKESLNLAGFEPIFEIPGMNAVAGNLTKEGLDNINKNPNLTLVELDRELNISTAQSFPLIKADIVRNMTVNGTKLNGTGQTVCVIDTGVDYNHAELGNCTGTQYINGNCSKVIGGWDLYNGDNDPDDDNGHGTAIAGIIAADGPTYKGIASDTKIVAIKIAGNVGQGWTSLAAAGINWCVNNASIYNITTISFAFSDGSQNTGTACDGGVVDTAVAAANAKNITVHGVAGNNGYVAGISFPGCVTRIISTSAIRDGTLGSQWTDTFWAFSNRGSILDLLGPGFLITRLNIPTGTATSGGTSLAMAHSVGSDILLRQYNEVKHGINLTPSQIRNILKLTGKSINDSGASNLTFPRIDLLAAIYYKPTSTGNVKIVGRDIFVNSTNFTIKGVGYAPVPIGSSAGQWPDTAAVYNRDFSLLNKMHINTIRTWGKATSTMLDRAAAHNIYVIAGYWVNYTLNFSNQSIRTFLKNDFKNYVSQFKNKSAVLMWAIGNEQNYNNGNNPEWYSLANEMAREAFIEEGLSYHPVAIVNGEIATIGNNSLNATDSHLTHVDVWGANVYRGISFGSMFNNYALKSSKPLWVSEYGIDSYNNTSQAEYRDVQANYAVALWTEINNSNVSIGGTIMEYSDEWWKAGNVSLHDAGGYAISAHPDGFSNEEYWGLVWIQNNGSSPDIMHPKDAYYDLRDAFRGYNNPPILNFTNITVNESDLVQINRSLASDPDNDFLTFYFTSPLNSSGEWQTNYTDAGVYNTTITVSDGNLNASQNITITVLDVDITPPGTVTGLSVSARNTTWIYWTWTNPADSDFSQAIVYIDNVNVVNTSNNHYNATGFSPNTAHTIKIHTKDTNNNINNTDVTDTATTNAVPVLPDLVINSSKVYTTSPTAGTWTTFKIIIANIGSVAANNIHWLFDTNYSSPPNLTFGPFNLDPGKTVAVYPAVNYSSSGTYNTIFTVDYNNSVQESNESNNQATIQAVIS